LRLPENVWIAKYILAASKYWDNDIGCDAARGRRNILVHMLDMKQGDIIFLPKIGIKQVSDSRFSVATVSDGYFFEDRSQDNEFKDFAHIIKIKKVKTYPYPTNAISDAIFGAPFRHAIDPVEPYYKNNVYDRLSDFVQNEYL
jgi:hypothetical protein